MKIVTVVGARPQFIKAAVLSQELAQRGIDELLVHTGQHYDHNMSQVFFDGLSLKEPRYHLEVGSGSHAAQTAAMMTRLEPVLEAERPDCVLVYGDTNTTLAGALVAAKLHIPLGHVEAGLRSFNRQMPEEVNRIVSDHLADLHFAPTARAVQQLADEGITKGVHQVGDLMVDLVHRSVANLPSEPDILKRFQLLPGCYAVATVHRAGNTDEFAVFRNIMEGFRKVDLPIVFPVHPRTATLLSLDSWQLRVPNVITCEPLAYFDMLALQANARVIMTDSGGIQKEAYALRVPCVTLRLETEWVETLEYGWNVLAGCDAELIARSALRPKPSQQANDCYGDGSSAKQIAKVLAASRAPSQAIA